MHGTPFGPPHQPIIETSCWLVDDTYIKQPNNPFSCRLLFHNFNLPLSNIPDSLPVLTFMNSFHLFIYAPGRKTN